MKGQWCRHLSACVRAHGGHFEHILLCFHGSVRIFKFRVLLFDYFVYLHNVTCLKRFTRYGNYADVVEDIIIGRFIVAS